MMKDEFVLLNFHCHGGYGDSENYLKRNTQSFGVNKIGLIQSLEAHFDAYLTEKELSHFQLKTHEKHNKDLSTTLSKVEQNFMMVLKELP